MSAIVTSPSPQISRPRRTRAEAIREKILKNEYKISELTLLNRIFESELDVIEGRVHTYDNVEDLIYDLEHS
jgi:hypothetical protein